MKYATIFLVILTNELALASYEYNSYSRLQSRRVQSILDIRDLEYLRIQLHPRGVLRAQTVREEGRGTKEKANAPKPPSRSSSSESLSTGRSRSSNISPIRSTRTEGGSPPESPTRTPRASSGSFVHVSPIRSTIAEGSSTPRSPSTSSTSSLGSISYPSPIHSNRAEQGYSPDSSRSSIPRSGPSSAHRPTTPRNSYSGRSSLESNIRYGSPSTPPGYQSPASDQLPSSNASPQGMLIGLQLRGMHDSPMSMVNGQSGYPITPQHRRGGRRSGHRGLGVLQGLPVGPGSSDAETVYPRE